MEQTEISLNRHEGLHTRYHIEVLAIACAVAENGPALAGAIDCDEHGRRLSRQAS